MEWTEKLSIGVEMIDGQHRELFKKINELVTAIHDHTCKERIGDVIQFLEDYIIFHFGAEEKYMQESRYPGYPWHREYHKRFMDNFQELKKELNALEGGRKRGSYELSVMTNQVVVDWILDHISEVDRKFGAYLKERGS